MWYQLITDDIPVDRLISYFFFDNHKNVKSFIGLQTNPTKSCIRVRKIPFLITFFS